MFTIPKMLRPYFLRHRRLLGRLCRAASETVQELMAEAAIGVEDDAAVKRLARYILRPPVSLERMVWGQGSDEVAYTRKAGKGQPGGEEHMDALDFLARVFAYIPEPRQHTVFYYAWYSNVSRGRRRKGRDPELATHTANDELEGMSPAERQAMRRAWARLIKLV